MRMQGRRSGGDHQLAKLDKDKRRGKHKVGRAARSVRWSVTTTVVAAPTGRRGASSNERPLKPRQADWWRDIRASAAAR